MGSEESTVATANHELLSWAAFRDAEFDQVASRCDTVLDI
jgi:hypothetical protein